MAKGMNEIINFREIAEQIFFNDLAAALPVKDSAIGSL
jgi:hypothetical protein